MLLSLEKRHCSKIGTIFWTSFKTFFSFRAEATVEKKTANWARTKLAMTVYYNKLMKRA